MTKKNIAITLVLLWAVLILYRVFFTGEKEIKLAVPVDDKTTNIDNKVTQEKTVKYPEISGYKFIRDIFADLIKDTSASQKVQKEKKPEPIPAPPLPLLPTEPEIVEEKKQEIKIDKLNDIVLLGIMDKKEKRFAFLKKGNDIKSFKKMDRVFDTDFIIERISKTEVVLSDAKGDKRIFRLEKEGHDEKKD